MLSISYHNFDFFAKLYYNGNAKECIYMAIKYEVSYNFGEYQNMIEKFFSKLIQNSFQYFSKQVSEGKILKNNSTYTNPKYINELNKMKSFVKNVEEYLYYYYKNDRRNFQSVLNAVTKLEAISVLDDADRGIYGITHANNMIQISPILSGSHSLTPEQRTRLYVAHELGHMVNKKWMMQVTQHLSHNNILTNTQKQLFYDGFSLLNEATTQDRAEDIAYFYANRKRPALRKFVDSRGMYSGEAYKTNYDFYGELQEPAILFFRTLRGIGKIGDEQNSLREASKQALSPNFANRILSEYQKDGQMSNLYNELQYLGILKNASYARFGYGQRKFLASSKEALARFKSIAIPLRDYREPYGMEH